MKRRVLVAVLTLVAIVAVVTVTGCGECEHVYDHVCDTVCNECGFERTVSGHRYDNDCDAHCNKCNGLREVGEHNYTADCDADCDICGAKRDASEHVYDNACDQLCNACNFMREVGSHVYDNGCDASCNECNAERAVSEHVYGFVCDTSCDVCGFIREAEEHTYSGKCDLSCNVCGDSERANADEHEYSADCDTECGVCGEKRVTAVDHEYTNDCDAYCNNCNALRVNVSHSWSDWKSKGDATCTEDGTKYRRCAICKAEDTVIDKGTATGHYYLGSTGYTFNNDATHAKDGTESRICFLCEQKADTRTAPGTAGHSFGKDGKCKECGFSTPALSAYMAYESFEELQKLNQSFVAAIDLNKTTGKITVETKKTGVTYTIVSRGGLYDSNIRALKIARAASNNESGNDTVFDVAPFNSAVITAKHVIEFDIMIGSGNATNIYLNGRKEKNGSAVFNQFVWYNDARKSVYIGNVEAVKDVPDDQWVTVALAIDDEAKTYDIYLEGELAVSGLPYVKAGEYYSFSECKPGCYRITANKGTGAVEFYLDNVVLYNGEYREN